jgi:hypothetical protein
MKRMINNSNHCISVLSSSQNFSNLKSIGNNFVGNKTVGDNSVDDNQVGLQFQFQLHKPKIPKRCSIIQEFQFEDIIRV